MIGQQCIVATSGSKLLGIPTVGYSSWPSPISGSKCTYEWLSQPLFWSLKYGQLCTPDGGTVNQVTLPVNTNARIDYGALRTQLASGERSLHPKTTQVTSDDGRPAHPEFLSGQHIRTSYLREAQPVCRSCGAQVLDSVRWVPSSRYHRQTVHNIRKDRQTGRQARERGLHRLPLPYFMWPCPFCFVRERVFDCTWSSYWRITAVLQALLCAIP